MLRPFRRRAIVCRQAVALITDYLEGALTARDRERLEAHLGQCPHCREYLAQMRMTIDALGHVEPDDLDQVMLEDLVRLYQDWLRQ
jgi:anti-sigma factor RsiW